MLSIVSDLVDGGIEVRFDKWSLKEGQNTYLSKEQSTADPNITNVFTMLDT